MGKQIIFKGRGWWKVVIIVIKHSENLMNVTEFRLKKRSPSYLVYKEPVTEKLKWGCGPIKLNNLKVHVLLKLMPRYDKELCQK